MHSPRSKSALAVFSVLLFFLTFAFCPSLVPSGSAVARFTGDVDAPTRGLARDSKKDPPAATSQKLPKGPDNCTHVIVEVDETPLADDPDRRSLARKDKEAAASRGRAHAFAVATRNEVVPDHQFGLVYVGFSACVTETERARLLADPEVKGVTDDIVVSIAAKGGGGGGDSNCPADDPCQPNGTCTSLKGGRWGCTCDSGYAGQASCDPVCETPCGPNAYCSAPNECTCSAGWTMVDTICEPVCQESCGTNAYCSAPDVCACDAGWTMVDTICEPVCSTPCGSNAYCSAPDVCACDAGWMMVDTVCEPVCQASCGTNAHCSAPDVCACDAGWTDLTAGGCSTQVASIWAECEISCTDNPEGWYDIDGPTYDCQWYSQGTRCATYGDSYERLGTTANVACCACGGGNRVTGQVEVDLPSTEEEQCIATGFPVPYVYPNGDCDQQQWHVGSAADSNDSTDSNMNLAYIAEQNAMHLEGHVGSGDEIPWGTTFVAGKKAGLLEPIRRLDDGTICEGGDGCHPIKVFVLDTGIWVGYQGNELNINETLSKDFTGNTKTPAWNDGHGHGTHCSGTIGATKNGSGIVGVVPGVHVVAVKVLSDRGSGSSSGVIAGIDYAASVARPGDVISMSLGGGQYGPEDQAVINAWKNHGVLFALAAGNESSDASGSSPANAGLITPTDGVFTVSAVGKTTSQECSGYHDQGVVNASFSNYSPGIAVGAPGVAVKSIVNGGSMATWNGTSMATPHVAAWLGAKDTGVRVEMVNGVYETASFEGSAGIHQCGFRVMTCDSSPDNAGEPLWAVNA